MASKDEIRAIEEHIKSQKHNGRLLHNRRFRLTDKDIQLIRKQLKRWTLEDLCDAITQLHRTPWNLGDNPNGNKHLRLPLAIDDDHIQGRLEDFEKYESELEKMADRIAREKEKKASEPEIERSTITDTKEAYRKARKTASG